MKGNGCLGRWVRRYFVLRRRSLSFFASYHAYSTGGAPVAAERVAFVRLPEGDFGEARVLVGTSASPTPWLVQPDNRSEQCRWVNALWWALEPTEDELRQLQISYDMAPPVHRRNRKRSTVSQKPDSLIIHKQRAERKQKAVAEDSRPQSADGPGKRNGRNSIIQPAVDTNGDALLGGVPEEGDDIPGGELVGGAAIGGVGGGVAGGGGGGGGGGAGGGEGGGAGGGGGGAKRPRVTFAAAVAQVHTMPEVENFDVADRRGLFYSVYDIMQFQHDAERPFDVLRDQLSQFCNRILCRRSRRVNPGD